MWKLSTSATVSTAAFALALAIASSNAAENPPIEDVESQPLAANVARLVDTLQYLGAPLASDKVAELKAVGRLRDARRLQQLLDDDVLFVVRINPESRVKVGRGPARPQLQQGGFTPAIVKFLNASTSTARPRITSPQAGAVYAGAAKFSLERQQQVELNERENTDGDTDRFLAVEYYGQPPMLPELSGLAVEYGVVLLYCSESGKRDVTIGFDLGQGEQDLGFRGETSVLFEVNAAIPLRLKVHDHDGSATTAHFTFRDRYGHVHPLQAKRLAPDLFFQPHVYRSDGEIVWLPPGKLLVEVGRGPEYRIQTLELEVGPTPKAVMELDVHLQRWIDPRTFGFYSGDHHIHAAGCAHYTVPTEGVSPADMFRQIKGEALNVGCVLTWGPCYDFQRRFFSERPDSVSERLHILKYDLEVSGFGSQALGHVCLLNLKDQTYPGSDGTSSKAWPTWTTPVLRWTKQQGGVTGYAHSASGLHIEPSAAAGRMLAKFDSNGDSQLEAAEFSAALLPESAASIDTNEDGQLDLRELEASHDRASDRLPNLAIPEMNGVGAMEIFVSCVEGVCDFISAMDTRRIQEWNTWYHLLNCGFPLKVSGETDFPCMSSRRVGQGRVYVQLGSSSELNFSEWCTRLAAGASYVSDGFAHALKFEVNGVAPGNGEVAMRKPGNVTIRAAVAFAAEMPLAVSHGTERPHVGRRVVGDTVELHAARQNTRVAPGEQKLELIVNGHVAAESNVPADGRIHEREWTIAVSKSSWIAVRHFPQMHTNPVNVIIDGAPIRASKSSARWCLEALELLWSNRAKNIADKERAEASEAFERARAAYRRIFDESIEELPQSKRSDR